MQRLIIILSLIAFFSCVDRGKESRYAPGQLPPADSVTFIQIRKDSAYTLSYKMERLSGDTDTYRYTSANSNFAIRFVHKSNEWTGIFGPDTAVLYIEQVKWFTVNNEHFEVYKLIRDRGVTDGEVFYFLTKKTGLLITKSGTWRAASFLKEKDDRDIVMTSLIFEVMNDAEFFGNKKPDTGPEFIPPRLGH